MRQLVLISLMSVLHKVVGRVGTRHGALSYRTHIRIAKSVSVGFRN